MHAAIWRGGGSGLSSDEYVQDNLMETRMRATSIIVCVSLRSIIPRILLYNLVYQMNT